MGMNDEGANPGSQLALRAWLKIFAEWVRRGRIWAALRGAYSFGYRIIRGAPPRQDSEILPQLHVDGQYRSHGWPLLEARGVTAVVSLRAEFDNASAGLAPDRYLHLPTIDNTPPSLEHLREGVDFIMEEINRGGTVYIHCAAGVGRAPTLAAAYLVARGMSPPSAWEKIREARPFIQPTRGQKAQIDRFAARLSRNPEPFPPEVDG